uniref:Uncharacterized protein n=1 Tax=Yersinia enterocolitica W22703 TaxID=913028 RepID=F4MW64_YEREN|nr:unknown protein [Yersinia enterocolitica W22703]
MSNNNKTRKQKITYYAVILHSAFDEFKTISRKLNSIQNIVKTYGIMMK